MPAADWSRTASPRGRHRKGQGVTLTGDHKAGGNLSVSSRSDIVLSNGTLNSDKDLSLTAGGRITQQNEN
ncbi:hypothetical protein DMI60_08570 [Escherichia coli]|nr:hypothetical protein [Escherichia coli]